MEERIALGIVDKLGTQVHTGDIIVYGMIFRSPALYIAKVKDLTPTGKMRIHDQYTWGPKTGEFSENTTTIVPNSSRLIVISTLVGKEPEEADGVVLLK